MTNRPIPYDEGAEGALLGAMLLSPSAIETAERTLVSSDFYSPAHLRIFDAILELHAVGAAVDPKTVASHLGDLASIGGPDKLIALIANVPAISSAIRTVDAGVVSLGLRTTVLPAASAGANFQTAIIIG